MNILRLNLYCLLVSLIMLLACTSVKHGVMQSSTASRFVLPTLSSGDQIEIKIFDEPELSGVHIIASDGSVRLPLVGVVKLSGSNVDEAAAIITKVYSKRFLKNAKVSVFAKRINSRQIYVLGQVNSPGPYPYRETMNIIAAIAKAGGVTKVAAANRTLITREHKGKLHRFKAKVNSIQKGREKNIILLPGDIIFVPESIF